MSQFDMPTIDPTVNTGTQLSAWLNSWQDAVETTHAGPVRPAYVKPGTLWIQQITATQWKLYCFDGTHDILLIEFNPTTGGTVGQFLPLAGGTLTGDLNFSGLGRRITGDFSNATVPNRTMFQTNIVNGSTIVGLIPNGAARFTQLALWTGLTANEGIMALSMDNLLARIRVGALGTQPNVSLAIGTANTDMMQIDPDGTFSFLNIGAGTTQTKGLKITGSSGAILSGVGNSGHYFGRITGATNDGPLFTFTNTSNAGAGDIYMVGATIAYRTTSDYRLKNIIGKVENSGDFIDALRPCFGTWKENGYAFCGFLAHELQSVSLSSAWGEKDAVDDEGKPILQMADPSSSEIIANIVAELQSVRGRLALAGL